MKWDKSKLLTTLITCLLCVCFLTSARGCGSKGARPHPNNRYAKRTINTRPNVNPEAWRGDILQQASIFQQEQRERNEHIRFREQINQMRRQAQFLHPASEKGNTSGIFLNYTLGTIDRLLMKMGGQHNLNPRAQ